MFGIGSRKTTEQAKHSAVSESGVNYEQLGKSIEGILVKDYIYFLGSTKRQIWGALVRGIFTGLGGVIGATLFVALLLTILHYLGGAPFIGHYFKVISDNIKPK
jgi:hypothetical protein